MCFFSCNSMPCRGCSALHGVNPIIKKPCFHQYLLTEIKICVTVRVMMNCFPELAKFPDLNIHKKTLLLESLFSTIAVPWPCKFIKKVTLTLVFSCEHCQIFKNTYFEKHLNGCFLNLMKVLFDHEILSFWTCYEKHISCAFY